MKVIGRLFRCSPAGSCSRRCWGCSRQGGEANIEPIDAPDADEVRLAAIFEPMSFRSTATAFRGGSVDCWYGGGVIDLRDAILDPAGARLQVRAIFGGAQIVVPDTWRVSSRVVGIGGLGDGRPPVEPDDGAPHLTIEGVAIFGGFGVTSELPEGRSTRARRGRGQGGPPQAQGSDGHRAGRDSHLISRREPPVPRLNVARDQPCSR